MISDLASLLIIRIVINLKAHRTRFTQIQHSPMLPLPIPPLVHFHLTFLCHFLRQVNLSLSKIAVVSSNFQVLFG